MLVEQCTGTKTGICQGISSRRVVCLVFYFTVVVTACQCCQQGGLEVREGKYITEEEECVALTPNMSSEELVHVDFEVYGRVQGVFFRKHTQDEGAKLGLRGFCRNTSSGTVSGSMEGPRGAVDRMKHWLEHTGSPMSRISKAVFKNEKVIDTYSFPAKFDIARTV